MDSSMAYHVVDTGLFQRTRSSSFKPFVVFLETDLVVRWSDILSFLVALQSLIVFVKQLDDKKVWRTRDVGDDSDTRCGQLMTTDQVTLSSTYTCWSSSLIRSLGVFNAVRRTRLPLPRSECAWNAQMRNTTSHVHDDRLSWIALVTFFFTSY